jgi:hypothetical protein
MRRLSVACAGIVAVLVVVLTVASPARAQLQLLTLRDRPLRLSTTSTLIAEYRHDNYDNLDENDRVADLVERLNVKLDWGPVGAALRLDGVQFLHRGNACDPSGCRLRLEHDLRPGQFSAWYRASWIELTGGDVTAQFGRGLALSIRKVDEIGLDLALRGGRVQLRTKDHSVTLVAGLTNHNEVDLATAELIDDPLDLIVGGRYEVRLFDRATLGAHYVFSSLTDTPDPDGFIRYHIPGLSLQLPRLGPHLSLEAEGAYLRRDASNAVEGQTDGYALFAGLTGHLGPATLLLELKHYRRFSFGRNDAPALLYHEPPSLERLDQLVPNNHNVLGGRIRLTLDLLEGKTSPFINLLIYALNDQTDQALLSGADTRLVYHLYAGVEQSIGAARLKLSLGLREDRFVDDGKVDPTGKVSSEIKRRVVRTDGGLSPPLGRHSLDFKWELRTELRPLLSADVNFLKGRLTATWGYGGWITLAALLSWDWDPDDPDPLEPALLGGAEAKLQLWSWGVIKLFGGGLHGGLVCVSGSCRRVPTFTGVRTELVLRL